LASPLLLLLRAIHLHRLLPVAEVLLIIRVLMWGRRRARFVPPMLLLLIGQLSLIRLLPKQLLPRLRRRPRRGRHRARGAAEQLLAGFQGVVAQPLGSFLKPVVGL
jgi:hypothetical protein